MTNVASTLLSRAEATHTDDPRTDLNGSHPAENGKVGRSAVWITGRIQTCLSVRDPKAAHPTRHRWRARLAMSPAAPSSMGMLSQRVPAREWPDAPP